MNRHAHGLIAGAKLGVFLAVSVVVVVTIAATVRPLHGSGRTGYTAVFADASDLAAGDQVRVAGVVSGHVTGVELDDDARALVSFEVDDDLSLTTSTTAQVKYLNLIGNRYLSLAGGEGARLDAGATIPVARTRPALDLDALFAGFKPLLSALSPDDANALAEDIVQTLQGEGGTVTSLLAHTADVTSHLADRDRVVGRVVDNLDQVLATVDSRERGLDTLVGQLARYLQGLARDRRVIGDSITHVDAMAEETARLLHQARPSLDADIDHLAEVAETLDDPGNKAELDETLRTLPTKLARIIRVASYGSWFNFYLCNLDVRIDPGGADDLISLLLGRIRTITLHDPSARCRP